MTTIDSTMTIAPVAPPDPTGQQAQMRSQAVALEAFLFSEMLRASGSGAPSPSGGGETQFDSFLRQSQAEAVAASGQTGLAEAIYRSMQAQAGPRAAPG